MLFNKEPAVIFKVIEEILRAAIPVALIFNLIHWTEAQTGTVMIFIGVVIGGLSLLLTRSQTTSPDKVEALIKEAVKSPANTSVETVKASVEAKEST